MAIGLGIIGPRNFFAGESKHVESASADDPPGAPLALAGVSAVGRSSVEFSGVVEQWLMFACCHAPGGLVLEPAQPDGDPFDSGDRGGLQHLHAIGPAKTQRGPANGLPLGGPRPSALRRDGGGWLWLAGVIEQRRHV